MTQLNQLRQHAVETCITSQSSMSSMRSHLDVQFDKMFNNITRMAPMFRKHIEGTIVGEGVGQRAIGATGRSSIRAPVQLSKLVRTLSMLWHKWTLGLDGNLPAKDFLSVERGKVKFLYSRRAHVWRCISWHINAGISAEIAIDRIYTCFGHSLSVTGIIKAFQNSIKQHGALGHPNLRV